MLYESSSLDSISGFAMIVGLKVIGTSSEHYTTGIFWNVYSSFWHISNFRRTLFLNWCALQTRKFAEYTVRWTQVIGGAIRKISFLLERRLCQSFVHPRRPTGPIFRATSMSGRCISRSVIFEKISAAHLKGAPGYLLGWSAVLRKVLKILTRHGIPRLEQCCPHSGILTSLALASNGTVLMDSRDNVILFWLPGSGIIRNKSWLLKFHMAHAWCVKFLMVRRWSIQLFDHLITHEISMFTSSFWSILISMFWTLLVFIQIRYQFWQSPLCNVYRLWQPDELHQLLLGIDKDLLHWLLKYLKARNLKDQFDNRFTSVPQYPGLQCFSKPFDSMKSGSWQGKDIQGMIRTLAVNCAPILDCSRDSGKTAAETASNKMVIGAVLALCEFSLLVSQQNHSDLLFAALDDALKPFYKKKGAFWDQTMSKSAKGKVDELLAWESHELWEQKFHKIRAAMEVQLYGAGKVTTSKWRQFQLRLNRARQAATIWSDADQQRAIERLERKTHQVTSAKPKL